MNIPNALSLFRILLVPVFALLFFRGGPYGQLYATGVFLLAGVTDMVDGHLARTRGQVTVLGRILDPLADKIMVLAALICCAVIGYIPLWAVLLYGVKECAQGLLTVLLFRKVKDVPGSNYIGKAGTVLFYITIAFSIILELPMGLKYALLGISLACVFMALASYVVAGMRLSKAPAQSAPAAPVAAAQNSNTAGETGVPL